jgi:MFS family permease
MAPTELAAPATTRATRARHWVVVFAATLSVITYIDRVCISKFSTPIQNHLGLSDVQMGWVFAAFAWAYALFEVPGGWLGDRIGPRKVLMRVVLMWSVFTALTGAASGFVTLLIYRFCSAPARPGVIRTWPRRSPTGSPRRSAAGPRA